MTVMSIQSESVPETSAGAPVATQDAPIVSLTTARDAQATVATISPVVYGTVIGSVEIRHGALSSHETVEVAAVLERCADLAVADRIAYLLAVGEHATHAVVSMGGWHYVVRFTREYKPGRLAFMRAAAGAPSLMTVATERGLVPQLFA